MYNFQVNGHDFNLNNDLCRRLMKKVAEGHEFRIALKRADEILSSNGQQVNSDDSGNNNKKRRITSSVYNLVKNLLSIIGLVFLLHKGYRSLSNYTGFELSSLFDNLGDYLKINKLKRSVGNPATTKEDHTSPPLALLPSTVPSLEDMANPSGNVKPEGINLEKDFNDMLQLFENNKAKDTPMSEGSSSDSLNNRTEQEKPRPPEPMVGSMEEDESDMRDVLESPMSENEENVQRQVIELMNNPRMLRDLGRLFGQV